ncbi:hypothetical protein R1sor_021814 [Riccia sorocarpa]|uniref:Uncharacterized protein n=1 Tax=Riccia sorocarpa TaxID=122646 RepID=A0ABD3GI48_9MARC
MKLILSSDKVIFDKPVGQKGGNAKELEQINKRIVKFVWGGTNTTPRQRIANKVLRLPKAQGGLGLLAASQQVAAFAAATVTWAFSPGKQHPLKQLI